MIAGYKKHTHVLVYMCACIGVCVRELACSPVYMDAYLWRGEGLRVFEKEEET